MQKSFVTGIGLLSLLYLINPTMGLFELIPDAMPLVGNLDEVAASTLLLAALKYHGLDLTNLFTFFKKTEHKDSH